MPGTLTLSTLSDGTNSTSVTNCIQGSAKAWVNFDGTTSPGTIRASYNVSSVTKNGAGDYTVNFTNALSDANYSIGGGGSPIGTGFCVFTLNRNGANGAVIDPTTSAVRVNTCNVSQTAADVSYVNVAIFR